MVAAAFCLAQRRKAAKRSGVSPTLAATQAGAERPVPTPTVCGTPCGSRLSALRLCTPFSPDADRLDVTPGEWRGGAANPLHLSICNHDKGRATLAALAALAMLAACLREPRSRLGPVAAVNLQAPKGLRSWG